MAPGLLAILQVSALITPRNKRRALKTYCAVVLPAEPVLPDKINGNHVR
jgi:hypothetical protein